MRNIPVKNGKYSGGISILMKNRIHLGEKQKAFRCIIGIFTVASQTKLHFRLVSSFIDVANFFFSFSETSLLPVFIEKCLPHSAATDFTKKKSAHRVRPNFPNGTRLSLATKDSLQLPRNHQSVQWNPTHWGILRNMQADILLIDWGSEDQTRWHKKFNDNGQIEVNMARRNTNKTNLVTQKK